MAGLSKQPALLKSFVTFAYGRCSVLQGLQKCQLASLGSISTPSKTGFNTWNYSNHRMSTCFTSSKLIFIQQNLSFHTANKQMHVEENHKTKSLTIWNNIKEIRSSPGPALILGLSGLVPFVSFPLYLTLNGTYMPEFVYAQIAYGASILSFLGGVRWGFALSEKEGVTPNWFNLSYSVLPSLVAWAGLLIPPAPGILCLIAGLGGTVYFDMLLPGYPPWFKGLRFVLSFVAVLALWTTFVCKYLLKKQDLHIPTMKKAGKEKDKKS